jgi:hypothetical protein
MKMDTSEADMPDQSKRIAQVKMDANSAAKSWHLEHYRDELLSEMLLEYAAKDGDKLDDPSWKKLKAHLHHHALSRLRKKFRLATEIVLEDPAGENSACGDDPGQTEEIGRYSPSNQAIRTRKAQFHELSQDTQDEFAELLPPVVAEMKKILSKKGYRAFMAWITKRLFDRGEIDKNEMRQLARATDMTEDAIMQADVKNIGAKTNYFRMRAKLLRHLNWARILTFLVIFLGMALPAGAHFCRNGAEAGSGAADCFPVSPPPIDNLRAGSTERAGEF